MSGTAKLLSIFGACLILFFVFFEPKEITKEGTVISHSTTGSKSGNTIYYHTIVRESNGNLVSKQGMSFYVIPADKKVYWKETMFVSRMK